MAKEIKLAQTEQATGPAEPAPKAPATKKPRKAAGKKKVEKPEVAAVTPSKRPARQLPKPIAKKAPGRKPGKKAAAAAPVVTRKKPAARKLGLIGRKADLIKMGEGAFLYSLDQQQRLDEMAQVIANYERIFEAVRQLFSREMEEIEEFVAGLLE